MFETLKATLFAAKDFQPDLEIPHRIYSVAERMGIRMPVDLVPFGGVEAPKGSLSWPPDGEFVMDVRGFGVALNHVIQIEIKPGLEILLPSPACMTVMKTLAWKDRGMATRGRDAIDLVELLLRAEDLFGLEVLYDDHLGIVEAKGGDLQLAAAHVLGAEARIAAGGVLAQEVASILVKGMDENLVTQVLGGSGGIPSLERNDSITNILESFLNGLQGPTAP
jgi:predicted nucleotidyltransferase